MEHQGDPPEKSPTSVDVRGGAAQERYIPHPTVGGDQTSGRGNTTDGYFDGCEGAADEGHTDGCMHSVFR